MRTTTRSRAAVCISCFGLALGACGSGDGAGAGGDVATTSDAVATTDGAGSDLGADTATTTGSDAASDSQTVVPDADADPAIAFANPPVCDDDVCPSVANLAGSLTRVLTLTAKGATRTFSVGGDEVTVAVALYNGSLPGPTVEIASSASDPSAPEDGDVLMIDLTNAGGLNVCCWERCPNPLEPEACFEPYCRDLGLRQGEPCRAIGTPTNIHTHGLHIGAATAEGGGADACTMTTTDPTQPDLPWDNIFVTIPASGTAEQMSCGSDHGASHCTIPNRQSFVFPLPPWSATSVFQPAPIVHPHWFGLQWYHPHMHEMSRDQLARGLAGALIVRNPAELEIPALAAIGPDGERVLVLQALPIDNDATPREHLRLLNGAVASTMTITAGETQRWRMLNATSDSAVQITLVGADGRRLPYHPIGFDGLPVPAIMPALESYYIMPGSRFEVLLTAPADAAGETFEVTWCEPATDIFHSPTDSLAPDADCTGTTAVIATLEVIAGDVEPVVFAPGDPFADLGSFGLVPDLWASEATVFRKIKFMQEVGVEQSHFFLDVGDGNGYQQFHMHQVCDAPIQATLGVVEEWTLENWTNDLHTFHLHVNPFQVDPSVTAGTFGAAPFYQDNILLPLGRSAMNPLNPNEASEPGVVKIRLKHADYVGTSVFHCHLLEHEDHGMMATITVSPAGEPR